MHDMHRCPVAYPYLELLSWLHPQEATGLLNGRRQEPSIVMKDRVSKTLSAAACRLEHRWQDCTQPHAHTATTATVANAVGTKATSPDFTAMAMHTKRTAGSRVGGQAGKTAGPCGVVGRQARLVVQAKKADAQVPPAWPARVVPPEVMPRDTPKVRALAGHLLGPIGSTSLAAMTGTTVLCSHRAKRWSFPWWLCAALLPAWLYWLHWHPDPGHHRRVPRQVRAGGAGCRLQHRGPGRSGAQKKTRT